MVSKFVRGNTSRPPFSNSPSQTSSRGNAKSRLQSDRVSPDFDVSLKSRKYIYIYNMHTYIYRYLRFLRFIILKRRKYCVRNAKRTYKLARIDINKGNDYYVIQVRRSAVKKKEQKTPENVRRSVLYTCVGIILQYYMMPRPGRKKRLHPDIVLNVFNYTRVVCAHCYYILNNRPWAI